MRFTQGTGTHPMAADAPPLVVLRFQRGVVGETARIVHLALLPICEVSEIRTLCGALLPADHVETLTPGHGMPCTGCLLSPRLAAHAPTENPSTAPALAAQNGTDLTPHALAARYQAWGWPVTLRRDHVWLSLGTDAVAVTFPASLAEPVTAILRQRRCPSPVLAHPYAPEHQVLLAGEPYELDIPWPPGVHQVTGTLPLPPTLTGRGPITWIHPPEPDALALCREIDVIAAVRAVLRDSPPASRPDQTMGKTPRQSAKVSQVNNVCFGLHDL